MLMSYWYWRAGEIREVTVGFEKECWEAAQKFSKKQGMLVEPDFVRYEFLIGTNVFVVWMSEDERAELIVRMYLVHGFVGIMRLVST